MQIKGENWITCTLVFLVRDGQVMLGRKCSESNLVAGRLNGYGGKVKDTDRSIRAAAIRELREETGKGIFVSQEDLEYVGLMFFHNRRKDGTTFTVKVFAYIVRKWEGLPAETKEMYGHKLWPCNNLPWDDFAFGDRFWVNKVLAGKKILGYIPYTQDQKALYDEPVILETDHLPDDYLFVGDRI